MFRFIITRVAQVIPTFFGITLVAFAFIRLLPGDPVTLLAGERGVTPERHAELMQQLGYDKPAWQQYFFYLADVVQGDLGKSVVTRQPVRSEEHTSELQSLMRISYAVFCLKKKKNVTTQTNLQAQIQN